MKFLILFLISYSVGYAAETKMPDSPTDLPVIKSEITQTQALKDSKKLDVQCASDNQLGRQDPVCASNPNHPMCAGLVRSISNSTNCAQWSPDGTICLSYGAHGYSGGEWSAFANEYQTALIGCYDRAARAKNSDMSIYNNGGGGQTTSNTYETNKGYDSGSGISGTASGGSADSTARSTAQAKNDKSPGEIESDQFADALAETEIDDGSEALGYERGYITKQTKKKEAFSSLFSESPFAQKLDPRRKEEFSTAIENSKDVAVEIAEKHPLENSESGEDSESGGVKTAVAKEDAPSSTPAKENSGYAFANLLKKAKANSVTNRSPASLVNNTSSKEAATASIPASQSALRGGDENTSIFERVKGQYRRRAADMRLLVPSDTSRALDKMETPELFRSL